MLEYCESCEDPTPHEDVYDGMMSDVLGTKIIRCTICGCQSYADFDYPEEEYFEEFEEEDL